MRVVGIDVGLTNMGLAVVEGGREVRPALERSSLFGVRPKRYSERQCHDLVRAWLDARWDRVFRGADLVLVEKQMAESMRGQWARKFLVIETALVSTINARGVKAELVAPRSVRAWSGCSTGDYGDNKKASVQFATRRVAAEVWQRAQRDYGPKMDDMADAYQTALYGLSRPQGGRRRKRAKRAEPEPSSDDSDYVPSEEV